MPFLANVVSVLIASPSDVEREREIIRKTLWRFNDEHAQALKVVLLPVLWETHARPELGTAPQELIDQQILASADVVVGLFWTKVGRNLPSGTPATIHELEYQVANDRPALLYFSSRPAPLERVEPAQMTSLAKFKKRAQEWGLYGTFSDDAELERAVYRDLLRVVRERLKLPVPVGAPVDVAQPVLIVSRAQATEGIVGRLCIRNTGSGIAEQLVIKLGEKASEVPLVIGLDRAIAALVPGAEVQLPIVSWAGAVPPLNAVLQWRTVEGLSVEQQQTIAW